MQSLMTSTTRPSITPSARSRRTYAWLLSLAIGPGLAAASCSDDAEVDPPGVGGSASSNAGSAGSASSGNAGAGTGGSAGANATGGTGGSAGNPGGAGNAGSTGLPNAGGSTGGPDASTSAFTLTSPAFDGVAGCGPEDEDPDLCDLFPEENTGLNGADNVSPELDWSGAPAGTQSFAIAFHDLSNVDDDDTFTHWVMWNIPASSNGLPAELPEGLEPGVPSDATRQVSFRESNAFAGSGAAGNVYEFVVFALSVPSIDPPGIDPGDEDPDAVQEFIEALDDEVLGTATLRARSEPN
jgi:phosphatidylethanolamine-binding protein (PEBP) family uncharacterized protein